jgi:hypothetical protein
MQKPKKPKKKDTRKRVSTYVKKTDIAPRVTWLSWCQQCGKGFKRRGFDARKNKFCSYPCFVKSGGPVRAGLEAARMTRKYGAKKDANHSAIVELLTKTGTPFIDTSPLGYGAPDLCVSTRDGRLNLWEVKNLKTSYGKRGLNPRQVAWAKAWQGGPVYVIESVDDALRFLNGERQHVKAVGGYKWGEVVRWAK